VLVAGEWRSVAGADEWGVQPDAAAVAAALDPRGRKEGALLCALRASFGLPAPPAAGVTDGATQGAGASAETGAAKQSLQAVQQGAAAAQASMPQKPAAGAGKPGKAAGKDAGKGSKTKRQKPAAANGSKQGAVPRTGRAVTVTA
jgi:hypothetical protein